MRYSVQIYGRFIAASAILLDWFQIHVVTIASLKTFVFNVGKASIPRKRIMTNYYMDEPNFQYIVLKVTFIHVVVSLHCI